MLNAIGNFFNQLFYVPLFNLLFFFVTVLPGDNLGLGIIALTVLVRLVLLPSYAQSVRAQRELAVLQPKIDEIRATYKDKPEELNKRIVQVYQDHNVNPLGSCLPLLIQLPILYILYRVFLNGITPDNYDLLYPFIAAPEYLNTNFLGADLNEASLVMAVIAGALQFVQTWQLQVKRTKSGAPEPTDPAARTAATLTNRMLYFMPLLTVFIAATLPSALAVYWITTTVFSILQQWWILRTQPAVATPHVAVTIKQPHEVVTVTDEPMKPKKTRRSKRSKSRNQKSE